MSRRTCFVIAASLAFGGAAAAAATAQARPATGIGYDQISRWMIGATPPPPDSFAADAARIAALPPMSSVTMPTAPGASTALGVLSMVPLVGGFAAMANQASQLAYAAAAQAAAKKMVALFRESANAGRTEHVWFYGGWTRVDDGVARGLILKPDQGLRIALDLTKKTYRQIRTDARPASSGETYVVSTDDVAATVLDSPATESLGSATIAGWPARGYRTTATFTFPQTSGLCASGRHELTEVEYVADLPDPESTLGPALSTSQIISEACQPKTPGSHREPGRLALFRSTAVTRGIAGDFVYVLERGNIRALSAGDAAIFSVPPNFTEEH